jgi:hypothetical protein
MEHTEILTVRPGAGMFSGYGRGIMFDAFSTVYPSGDFGDGVIRCRLNARSSSTFNYERVWNLLQRIDTTAQI